MALSHCGVFIRGVSKRTLKYNYTTNTKEGGLAVASFLFFVCVFVFCLSLFGLLKKTLRLRKRQYPCCPN